jgi:hypothetical protein
MSELSRIAAEMDFADRQAAVLGEGPGAAALRDRRVRIVSALRSLDRARPAAQPPASTTS